MEIDHLTVPVRSYDAAKRFYAGALGPLGFGVRLDWPHRRRAYLGLAGEPSSLWLVESAAAGSLRLSLVAGSAGAVDRFHAAALAAGGTSCAAPGVDRDRSSDRYAARVADPDGNEVEAVFRSPAGSAERRPLAA